VGGPGLALLAVGAQAEEFQGVKQGTEAPQMGCGQLQAMHRAMGQTQGVATIHAGEVVFIALCGSEESLAAGEMATAHQSALLQLTQMAIDRGQAHRPLPRPQAGMKILPGELVIGLTQHLQQVLLAG
jgi:hypothetical protein